ncbi:hypothetical protein [Acinetobacter baumannii]|uniref:hypothetical protein n=1 Tax=Acinetobacter baumannii TaxID=470 RepID=UPI000BF3D15A|nr:hypothetical protein [Acinetobacter baumannii]MCL6176169.1 hypothetical protein [Acinetobacter baumannii]MCL6178893.1 hypothetical protein [Acinetobacter baumannii]MCL6185802.1 hypothetical protein [Acinetobacter baumannii]MCL6207071.1 hypothetical protein [Acinetobacter baumannii]MCL6210367.1 hypothetical protein [Acinetobacter baumannii]
MFNEDEEKLAHENWYKNNDPIAYKFYRDLSPEFETDFYTSEIAWLARAKAQAVPETHLLIPKEPKRKTIMAMACVCLGSVGSGPEFLTLKEAKDVYSALVEKESGAEG